jgi:hypothetical protein
MNGFLRMGNNKMERKMANGYCVTNLRELLPNLHRLSNNDFFIESGDRFFFEVTTQSGDDLWDTIKYVQKKI